MGFEVGQKIGGYEFLGLLEESRIGVVYKVRNVVTER